MKEKLWAALGITCLLLILVGVVYGDDVYDSVTGAAPGVPDEPEIEPETHTQIKIVVKDAYTSKTVSGAEVYLNGRYVGTTHTDGGAFIDTVEFGEHVIEARYDGISDSQYISVSASEKFFTIKLNIPKDISLYLKDTETGKPIEDATVFLVDPEDTSVAYRSTLNTDELGKAILTNVIPASYQLRLESERGDWKTIVPSKYLTVTGTDTDIDVSVDMPNPRFVASLSCSKYGLIRKWGTCTVKIKNTDYEKAVTSTDTVVVLLIYAKDNEGGHKLIDKRVMDFDRLYPGESKEQTISGIAAFNRGQTEVVVGVVFEGWKFTPEETKDIGGITVTQDDLDKFISDAISWCGTNPDKCIGIITKIFGWSA